MLRRKKNTMCVKKVFFYKFLVPKSDRGTGSRMVNKKKKKKKDNFKNPDIK
jgi:hypothetical protein